MGGRGSPAGETREVPSDEEAAAAAQARQGGDVAYFLPRHEAEIDRLDVQHYALQERLGANYLAPLEQPARILDVGCGTGLWAYELCEEFPDTLVVGLDLAPGRRPGPDTYRFVRANLLQGLPFADDSFDFVHQRALVSGVPVRSWQLVVQDLVRVARPGGWVELVECPPWLESGRPVTARLCGLLQQVVRAQGLDSEGIVFEGLDGHLRRAGLVDVGKRVVDLAVGEWGGRVGSLMATDCRALFMRLEPIFEATFRIPERECRELVAAMQQEWEERRSTYSFAIALGRKSG